MLIYDTISPYGLTYLAGFIFLLALIWWRLRLTLIDALFIATFCSLFTIVGGRLGYALFYESHYFYQHPKELFLLYQGGMSFHGALIGLIAGTFISARPLKLALRVFDCLALTALLLLPLGRLMNFYGGEIYGILTSPHNPLATIYPAIDLQPRHPVTLYAAAGYFVFIAPLLYILWRSRRLNFAGALACAFISLQGLWRFIVDFWRLPDASLGYILGPLGLGQILAILQVMGGVTLFAAAAKYAHASANALTHAPAQASVHASVHDSNDLTLNQLPKNW